MKSRVHGTVRAALLASAFVGMCVQAQEVYVGAGLFGAQVGYAHALTPTVNLRADYMTLGNRSSTSNKSGTDYQSKLDWSRTALLVDWFPSASSSFRLTGGATFNKITYDMTAAAAGQTVDINGTSYTLGANEDATHDALCGGWLGPSVKPKRLGISCRSRGLSGAVQSDRDAHRCLGQRESDRCGQRVGGRS